MFGNLWQFLSAALVLAVTASLPTALVPVESTLVAKPCISCYLGAIFLCKIDAWCLKIDSIGRCQFCNQLSKESLLNQIVKRLRIPLINIPLLSRDYDVCSTHQPNECTLCAHFVDLWAQQLLFSCSTCYKPAASTPTAVSVKPVKKVLAWGRKGGVACIVLIFLNLVLFAQNSCKK